MNFNNRKSRIRYIKGYAIDVPDILHYVQEVLHPAVTDEYKKLAYRTVLQEVSMTMDLRKADELQQENMLAVAWQNWDATQKHYGNYHTLNDPLRFSIAIGRTRSGLILATAYHANVAEYDNLLDSLPEFSDYSWNTDKSNDEFSIQENRQRHAEWSTLISENDNFASLMEYKLSETHPFITWAKEKKDSRRFDNQPSPEERLKEKFRLEVIDALCKRGHASIDNYFGILRQVNDLMEDYSKEIFGTLPKPYSSGEDFIVGKASIPVTNKVLVEQIIRSYVARNEAE